MIYTYLLNLTFYAGDLDDVDKEFYIVKSSVELTSKKLEDSLKSIHDLLSDYNDDGYYYYSNNGFNIYTLVDYFNTIFEKIKIEPAVFPANINDLYQIEIGK